MLMLVGHLLQFCFLPWLNHLCLGLKECLGGKGMTAL